ncbi:hypothetical protein FQA39_LY08596 [Lamprigera yunnana]|nr:hypothetical protein FQA39_LY08596 [Lamprigera yunnana]
MIDDSDAFVLPKPYNGNCTPYNICNFTKQKVKEYVEWNTNMVFKVVVIGDVSVGKTCIINRFCHHLFETHYKATIGVDFEVETFTVFGLSVSLQILYSISLNILAIIVTFDLSNLITLSHCELWLKDALEANLTRKPLIFLVGNKMDLLSSAAYISMEEISIKVAENLLAEYWPVSAKNGTNVDSLFLRVAALLLDVHFLNKSEANDELCIGINLAVREKITKKKKPNCACNH